MRRSSSKSPAVPNCLKRFGLVVRSWLQPCGQSTCKKMDNDPTTTTTTTIPLPPPPPPVPLRLLGWTRNLLTLLRVGHVSACNSIKKIVGIFLANPLSELQVLWNLYDLTYVSSTSWTFFMTFHASKFKISSLKNKISIVKKMHTFFQTLENHENIEFTTCNACGRFFEVGGALNMHELTWRVAIHGMVIHGNHVLLSWVLTVHDPRTPVWWCCLSSIRVEPKQRSDFVLLKNGCRNKTQFAKSFGESHWF